MDQQRATTNLNESPVRDEVLKEIRFAVVIYGGVSLAIYINGIVQEMLKMVKATSAVGIAPAVGGSDSTSVSSEVTYRKLGQLLGDPDHTPAEMAEKLKQDPALPLKTRFIIDILSGTSAGGINAVFLGKALVNDQSLDGLEQLWVTQGNIESLINDRASLTSRLNLQKPPRSLLNSNRMYLELLSALDAMEEGNGGDTQKAALVENLDLFTTTTDLSGLNVPLTLADGVVTEKRHRNVFHFQYSEADPDIASCFSRCENPFLAFAARCTSAFPFAFEPMELNDIFSVLNSAEAHRGQSYCDPDTTQWQRYYKEYLGSNGRAIDGQPFQFRAFGDGGYLDNKPFSYAIETMLTRHAGLPVDRKLVYIEPNPEEPSPGPFGESRPNAIENSLSALLVLPRYETIREDLERVVSRNLQIEQIGRVVDSVKNILNAPASGVAPGDWLAGKGQYGGGYATYECLKLSTVTDDLSNLLADAFGIDTRSADGTAIRTLGNAWREIEYPLPENRRRFLLKFDINFRLRRIRQMWRRIQEQYSEPTPVADRAGYRAELQRIKAKLRPPYIALQRLLRQPIFDKTGISEEILSPEQMRLVVEPPSDLAAWPGLSGYQWAGERSSRGAAQRAAFILEQPGKKDEVTKLGNILADRFKPVMISASDAALASFANDESVIGAQRAARDFVRAEYEAFEKYDSAAFPITFGTDVDGSRPIDVHRISPRDAKARDDVLAGHEKLRGQLLGAFGGFLDETWRRNDILWGRLDGAERLITMVLPEPDQATVQLRKQLIDEAHETIVTQVLQLNDAERPDWKRHLRNFILEVPSQPAPELVARSAARATAVVGDLLGGISTEQSNPAKHLFRRVAMVGRLAWSLVEVSVPRTPLELLGTYWLQLLMLFSVMLVVIAAISGKDAVWRVAGILVAASTILYLGRETLRRYLRGEFVPSFSILAAGTVFIVCTLALLTAEVPTANWLLGHSAGLTSHAAVGWQRLLNATKSLPFLQWDRDLTLASVVMLLGSGVATMGAARRARQFRQPTNVLRALKFAKSWNDVLKALGETDRATRAAVIRALRADVVFASSYGLFFLAFGLNWLLEDDRRPVVLLVACAAIACGVAAAVLNVAGNNAAFQLVKSPLPVDRAQPLPYQPFVLGTAKWALVILAAALSASLWFV